MNSCIIRNLFLQEDSWRLSWSMKQKQQVRKRKTGSQEPYKMPERAMAYRHLCSNYFNRGITIDNWLHSDIINRPPVHYPPFSLIKLQTCSHLMLPNQEGRQQLPCSTRKLLWQQEQPEGELSSFFFLGEVLCCPSL